MGTLIQSGATTDTLTVDPTSKAIRDTLYDADGNQGIASPTGSYLVNLNFELTAVSVADVLIWSFFLPTTATVIARLRSINISPVYPGAGGNTSDRALYFQRFNGSTSGGTTYVPTKKKSSYAASAADIRFNGGAGGLTNSTTKIGARFWTVQAPLNVQGTVYHHRFLCYTPGQARIAPLEFNPGEGFGIYLHESTGSGLPWNGYVEWDEY